MLGKAADCQLFSIQALNSAFANSSSGTTSYFERPSIFGHGKEDPNPSRCRGGRHTFAPLDSLACRNTLSWHWQHLHDYLAIQPRWFRPPVVAHLAIVLLREKMGNTNFGCKKAHHFDHPRLGANNWVMYSISFNPAINFEIRVVSRMQGPSRIWSMAARWIGHVCEGKVRVSFRKRRDDPCLWERGL